jgi:putative transposase
MRDGFHWARLLSFVTGLVNQELLLRNEYLAAENRILRAHLACRLRLSDPERSTLAEIAKRLGRSPEGHRVHRQAGHHSRLVSPAGCPEVRWIPASRLSRPPSGLTRNRSAGDPFCAGKPGLGIRPNCGRTIQSGLCYLGSNGRQHFAPAQHRTSARAESHTTWKEFIRSHMEMLAGTDFFTVEVLTWRGLVTYYILFFIERGTRRVSLGITRHPDSSWVTRSTIATKSSGGSFAKRLRLAA